MCTFERSENKIQNGTTHIADVIRQYLINVLLRNMEHIISNRV